MQTTGSGLPTINLTGRQGCQVLYLLRLQTEYGYDFFSVRGSTDGTTFTDVALWTGQTTNFALNWY
jgi:hypothetical protein